MLRLSALFVVIAVFSDSIALVPSYNIKPFPGALTESYPEKYGADDPVQAHSKGDPNHAHIQPYAKSYGKYYTASDRGKYAHIHGKPHISRCPQPV